MRRSDLKSSDHVEPGIYILDGDPDDDAAFVLQGPFPDTAEGRRQANAISTQIAARRRCTVSIDLVVPPPVQ